MKNKIILFIFLVGIGLSAQNYSKGSHNISLGYSEAIAPGILLAYEYGFFEKLSLGLIGNLNPFPNPFPIGGLTLAVKGSYYFYQIEGLDTYIGGLIDKGMIFGLLLGGQYFFFNYLALNTEVGYLITYNKINHIINVPPIIRVGFSTAF